MYAAGAAELKIGSALSDAPGSALGTRSVMSATRQSAPIQTKSRGKRIPFIQKEVVRPSGNTNSMPLWGVRLSRSPKPLPRSSGVSATSEPNATPPMITAGLVIDGVAVGVCVGVFVCVGVDVAVGAGVDMRAGMGDGADVGGGLGVAVDLGMDVAVATAVGDGAITIGGADVDVALGEAVGLGTDAVAAIAVGDGAIAILGGRTDAVGDGVGGAAGALGAAQPAVIANMTAAIARAGGSAALITGRYASCTRVAPSPPRSRASASNECASGWRFRCSRTAFRSTPLPLP